MLTFNIHLPSCLTTICRSAWSFEEFSRYIYLFVCLLDLLVSNNGHQQFPIPTASPLIKNKGRAQSSRREGDSDVQTGIVAGPGMCRLQSEGASRVTGLTGEHLSHNERGGGGEGGGGGEEAGWGWDSTAWWLGTVRPSFMTAGSSPKMKMQT